MKIRTPFCHKVLPAIALLCATSPTKLPAQDVPTDTPAIQHAEAGIDGALASLGKAAEKFVGAFNNRDATSIAALFTPLGKIVGSDGQSLNGRQAIEEYHRGLFAGEKVPRIALEASDVELIAPGVAIESKDWCI